MPSRSDEDVRQAIEERLAQRSRETGQPLVRLRKRLVFERCLARLQRRKDSPWIIRGGFALELRLGASSARTAQDLDLGLQGGVEYAAWSGIDVAQALRDELNEVGEDRLRVIVPEQADVKPLGPGCTSYQFSVEARLAGRRFETVGLDVSVGDALIPPFETLTGSESAFTGIPPPTIIAISRAQHVAEKIHALTRPLDDRINTRVKDLADLMLLMDLGLPKAPEVRRVVEELFTARRQHTVPHAIGSLPATWKPSFAVMAKELGLAHTTLKSAGDRLSEEWADLFRRQ